MEVEILALPAKKAEEEWQAWKQSLAYEKTQLARDMIAIYGHMRKHGGKVIDIYEAMRIGSLNKDGDPKLAIVRADSKRVRFERQSVWRNSRSVSDGGVYLRFRNEGPIWDNLRHDVRIPTGFFPDWGYDDKGNIKADRAVETITPIIPARISNVLRSHKFENYHILWEVEEWKLAPPRDPMLLKRITPNMFLVLATWNLTNLERAVIRGRI